MAGVHRRSCFRAKIPKWKSINLIEKIDVPLNASRLAAEIGPGPGRDKQPRAASGCPAASNIGRSFVCDWAWRSRGQPSALERTGAGNGRRQRCQASALVTERTRITNSGPKRVQGEVACDDSECRRIGQGSKAALKCRFLGSISGLLCRLPLHEALSAERSRGDRRRDSAAAAVPAWGVDREAVTGDIVHALLRAAGDVGVFRSPIRLRAFVDDGALRSGRGRGAEAADQCCHHEHQPAAGRSASVWISIMHAPALPIAFGLWRTAWASGPILA